MDNCADDGDPDQKFKYSKKKCDETSTLDGNNGSNGADGHIANTSCKDHFTVEMIVSGVIMGGTGNIKQIDYLITDATITTMAAPTGSLWGAICEAAWPKFN